MTFFLMFGICENDFVDMQCSSFHLFDDYGDHRIFHKKFKYEII
jgi:hypothetical protein